MTNRIKASSLFETIVALMVIVLVFGIAMTMYVNILRTSTSLAELKASQKLEELSKETKMNKSYFDEHSDDQLTKIDKRVSKYQGKEGLLLLELEAFDMSDKRLAERKEIILDESSE